MIKEARYGKAENYAIEILEKLPENKFVIGLKEQDCSAYLVRKDNRTKENKVVLIPITKYENDYKEIASSGIELKEVFQELKIVTLDSLDELSKIKEIHYYE